MRMNIKQVISSTAKTAEITTTYVGTVVTRHCVKTPAGFRGYHPDTDGVRRAKQALADATSIAVGIETCEADLKDPRLNDPKLVTKEWRERIERRLAALQEQLAPAKTRVKVLGELFPEFVLYGG